MKIGLKTVLKSNSMFYVSKNQNWIFFLHGEYIYELFTSQIQEIYVHGKFESEICNPAGRIFL